MENHEKHHAEKEHKKEQHEHKDNHHKEHHNKGHHKPHQQAGHAPAQEVDENVLVKERMRKLSEIRESGVNPYPYSFKKTHESTSLLEQYKDIAQEEHSKEKVTIAGRIVLLRKMGKASFGHLLDQGGKIQFYIKEDDVGEKTYSLFRKLDMGDIIGISGEIFKTKTGEVSIYTRELTLLAKSIRPLPEKYHGLKDTETRYRKRYVDLIMNPEIREVFRKRSIIIKKIREILDAESFLEVETPTLQPQYGGANAKPFITLHNALNMNLYLRISDELYLKRLLVGGFDKVYEICKDFRNEGIDRTHNPEFTLLEWYEAYGDYNRGMELFEKVYVECCKAVNDGSTKITFEGKEIDLTPPWKRMRFVDAIKEYAGIDAENLSEKDLEQYCKKEHIEHEHGMSKGELMMKIFEEKCEQHLIQPTFVIDHPIESTPLCKPLRNGNKLFVERFEPFINTMEVGNAYSELNDPVLQKALLEAQAEKKKGGDEEAHPMDDDFVTAIEHAMPPTSGVGLGIDRMVMLLTGQPSIRDVIFFPTMKPIKEGSEEKKGSE